MKNLIIMMALGAVSLLAQPGVPHNRSRQETKDVRIRIVELDFRIGIGGESGSISILPGETFEYFIAEADDNFVETATCTAIRGKPMYLGNNPKYPSNYICKMPDGIRVEDARKDRDSSGTLRYSVSGGAGVYHLVVVIYSRGSAAASLGLREVFPDLPPPELLPNR